MTEPINALVMDKEKPPAAPDLLERVALLEQRLDSVEHTLAILCGKEGEGGLLSRIGRKMGLD